MNNSGDAVPRTPWDLSLGANPAGKGTGQEAELPAPPAVLGQPSAPVASQQSRILRADGARDYGEVNKTVKMENETLEKNEPDGMNHTTSEWPVLNRPQVAGFDSPDDKICIRDLIFGCKLRSMRIVHSP